MRLKAGSTILVPKATAGAASADIADNIAENAQIALEADRGDARHKGKMSRAERLKATAAHAVAEIKSRVTGSRKAEASVHGHKHR